jgi:hypothetical protein
MMEVWELTSLLLGMLGRSEEASKTRLLGTGDTSGEASRTRQLDKAGVGTPLSS